MEYKKVWRRERGRGERNYSLSGSMLDRQGKNRVVRERVRKREKEYSVLVSV